jgi:ABC-type sugar transport system permease subunit/ABC-type glycerol-3-phosphate transport system substrate-binding protein
MHTLQKTSATKIKTVSIFCLAIVCLLTCIATPLSAAPQDAQRESQMLHKRELIVWGQGKDRGLDAALRLFESEHPGWKIITTSGSSGGMDPQKLMCSIAGQSPPDMLKQDRFSVGEWAARDAFLSLDEFISASRLNEELASNAARHIKEGNYTQADQALEALAPRLATLGPSRQADLTRHLTNALKTNTPPDTLHSQLHSQAAELQTLLSGVHPDRFFKACWQEASFGLGDQRRVFAIPNSTDDRALYYNEALFERAGLVDRHGRAQPPRNWAELKQYAVRLTEYDAAGKMTRLGFAPNYGNSWLYIYGWLNGGRFMSPDGRACSLDDPRIVEALEYMVEIYDALGGIEQVDSFQSAFRSGEFDPFFTGKVAMKIDGNWMLNNIADYAPNLRFNVVPTPAPAGHQPITWSGGFSWAIPVGSRHPQIAFELIRFLNTDRVWRLRNQVAARYAASRGRSFVPSMAPMPHINADAYNLLLRDNPDLPQRITRNFLLFADLMQVSRYRPVTPVGQLLWDEHARAYEKAVRHTYTPAQALQRGQRTVQAELDLLYAPDTYAPLDWRYPIVLTMLLALVGAVLMHRHHGGANAVGWTKTLAGYAFVSPWLIGFLLFTAGPIIVSIVYSFCRYDVLHPAQFVGLENYRRLFFDDPLFWKSLANTVYMMLGVPLGMAVGLGIAMLLNLQVRGMGAYRTLFYLPAIVPVVASAMLWIWVLNPELGLVNAMLRMAGFTDPPNWLQSASWLLGSKAAIILMGLWGAGSGMIIWLAGLKAIPQYLYEAASIDGATTWGRFIHVTVPMLSPYIFFNLIMGIIGTMQIFTQAYIMTQGGPDDSTMFYAYYLFNNAFRYFKMGYASALAWILFLFILALTLVQLKLAPRWVHYEAE